MNIQSKLNKLFVVSGMLLGMGSMTNAHAFILNTFNLDLNGAPMSISNLGGAAGFDISLTLANSSSIGIVGPLTTMSVGGSSTANSLVVNGALGLDVLPSPAFPGPELSQTFSNQTVFSGSITTTLNSLTGVGTIPGTLDASTASFSGQITDVYNGTFDNFPLLGITGAGAGTVIANFAFDGATDILTVSISESTALGTSLEDALSALDGSVSELFGIPPNGSISAFVYAGNTISTDANGAINSIGNFVITERVPEPASLALIGLGILGMSAARRRRNSL